MRLESALQRAIASPSPFSAQGGTVTTAPILAGLLGRGIRASRSPHMHEAEGARLGLSYAYKLLDFDQMGLTNADVAGVVDAAARHGFAGLNVTHPFKAQVIEALDSLSADAAAIGAVNTVVFRAGKAVGHNTDCWGFAESFRRQMPGARHGHVVQVGAGGAGMAVARALLDIGVERLQLHDIDRGKAIALAESLSRAFGPERVQVVDDPGSLLITAHGLVNATPLGMAKYPGMPVPAEALHPGLWVADIVYFPADTTLLTAARVRGCRVLPGAGMAIFQAVKAFELITGVAPDATAMAHHFASDGRDA